jgi:hypothetical protein
VLVLHEGSIAFTGTPDELRAIARPEDVGASPLERGLWRVLSPDAT